MVETISPVVHGTRTGRWAGAVALHVLGAGLSAAAFGAALGGAGSLLGAPWGLAGTAAVTVVAVLYALREVAGLGVPIPERREQVPEWWRTFFSAPVASFLYGAALGVGFLTYLRHGTLVVVSAVAVSSGEPLLGAVVVAPFGLARSLALVVIAGARTPSAVSGVVDRLERLAASRLPSTVNGAVLLAVALAAALGGAGQGAARSAAVAVLAVAFAWAAAAKVLRPGPWREAIAAHAIPSRLSRMARVGVPVTEAAVPVLAVAGWSAGAGALALGLLGVFSVVLVRTWRLRGAAFPCGCFGRRRVRDVRILLARNAGLAAVAVAVLAGGPDGRLAPWVRMARGLEVLPAAMVLVGVVLATLLLRRAASLRAS